MYSRFQTLSQLGNLLQRNLKPQEEVLLQELLHHKANLLMINLFCNSSIRLTRLLLLPSLNKQSQNLKDKHQFKTLLLAQQDQAHLEQRHHRKELLHQEPNLLSLRILKEQYLREPNLLDQSIKEHLEVIIRLLLALKCTRLRPKVKGNSNKLLLQLEA